MATKQDIDELESDYGDGEEYDDDRAFNIRDPLPLPSASVYTTLELHKLIHQGYIDLNPPYQRDPVWSIERQTVLIESIYRNYYIPPILFLVTENDPTSDTPLRVCMDGKQRLTSIQAFFDGQIPYQDPVSKKKYYYTVPLSQANRRLQIPDRYKQVFASKQITCVEYQGIDSTVERDIFQRVQLGMQLTAAEKLAAISSPYANWITELDYKHVRDDAQGLVTLIKFNYKRGAHFQCLAQMVYCIEKLPGRSEPTTTRVQSWLKRVDAPGPQLQREIEAVLGTYWFIANDENLKRPFDVKNKVAPVEFVFIGVLLAVLRDSDNQTKSTEIGNLRDYVRQQHSDIRANGRVITTLWNFIDTAKERATKRVALSRKRRKYSEDEADDDFRPTPITSLGQKPKTRPRLGK